jgi:hypothetical protein
VTCIQQREEVITTIVISTSEYNFGLSPFDSTVPTPAYNVSHSVHVFDLPRFAGRYQRIGMVGSTMPIWSAGEIDSVLPLTDTYCNISGFCIAFSNTEMRCYGLTHPNFDPAQSSPPCWDDFLDDCLGDFKHRSYYQPSHRLVDSIYAPSPTETSYTPRTVTIPSSVWTINFA